MTDPGLAQAAFAVASAFNCVNGVNDNVVVVVVVLVVDVVLVVLVLVVDVLVLVLVVVVVAQLTAAPNTLVLLFQNLLIVPSLYHP